MTTLTITNCDPSTCGRDDCPMYDGDAALPLAEAGSGGQTVTIECSPWLRTGVVAMLKNFVAAYQERQDGTR